MSQYLFLLLVLACPLMMIFMMRGHGHGQGDGAGHGRGGHAGHAGCGHGGHPHDDEQSAAGVDDLRRQRDELDRQIAEREWQGANSDDRSVERV